MADTHKIAASATINGDGSNASAIGAVKDDQMYAVTGAITSRDMAPSAVAAINVPGAITANDTIVLTRGVDAATWTVTTHANYPGMTITFANATTITVDMNGAGDTDMTLTLSGIWEEGDTATFSVTTGPGVSGP